MKVNKSKGLTYPAVFALSLVIILTIALSGCSSDGSGDGDGIFGNSPPPAPAPAEPNQAPTITVPTSQSVTQGQTLALTITGTDPNTADVLVYMVSGAPLDAVLDSDTGVFSWQPTFDEIGVHTLTFTVSDGSLEDSGTVQVTVTPNPVTDPPAPLAGGTIDPLAIPKYVTPLVIPPVMNNAGASNSYAIAVRQFQQQILPGGVWNTLNGRSDAFPPTTIWSYGPDADPLPDSSALGGGVGVAPAPNSQFNYPSYTIETLADTPVSVRWINDLVDESGNYLPHLLTVDQTLHWANPPQDCANGTITTDCMGDNPLPYTGPVPIVTHVHGAHVDGHSDGYPEAWWLPAASNIPSGYATSGGIFDDSTGSNPGNLGYADYLYRNDQPATTLWYHDHSLGMTRLNVYAGPAGFWLIRGDYTPTTGASVPDRADDQSTPGLNDGTLPGPAPVAGDALLALNVPGDPVRNGIREIPIVIQDRSFNADGSLFYPDNRAFFEGLDPADLNVNFVPDSDIAPQWNPEAFFNVMVVNGVSWPELDVAQAQYRFRLLNGCNSRFLNLALFVVDPLTGRITDQEIPFYVIGAEQGYLPQIIKVATGIATPLPGNGTIPVDVAAPSPYQALLMGLAERADVLVDFSTLAPGTIVRMINTAPDSPFGGFEDVLSEVADPLTTGQIMQFVVNPELNGSSPTDPDGATPATAIGNLVLNAEVAQGVADNAANPRRLSLNEEESTAVCVAPGAGGLTLHQITSIVPAADESDIHRFQEDCEEAGGEPFAPKAALLGTVDVTDPDNPVGIPLRWTDTSGVSTLADVLMADGVTTIQINVTENPTVGATEEWEIYNFTEDAHPIHLHLVRFEVISRTLLDGLTPGLHGDIQPWELGYKDTVIAYPGEITKVKATFDLAGLYVWHCHIVEHEDNEMMRPYVVSPVPE